MDVTPMLSIRKTNITKEYQMNADYFLMFIDYMLIPALSLSIDLKRGKEEIRMSLKSFLTYVSYAVAIVIITYVIRVVMSRLGITADTNAGTGIYTIMATCLALILPYIKEMIVTYIDVRCEIKGKKGSTPVDEQ